MSLRRIPLYYYYCTIVVFLQCCVCFCWRILLSERIRVHSRVWLQGVFSPHLDKDMSYFTHVIRMWAVLKGINSADNLRLYQNLKSLWAPHLICKGQSENEPCISKKQTQLWISCGHAEGRRDRTAQVGLLTQVGQGPALFVLTPVATDEGLCSNSQFYRFFLHVKKIIFFF